MNLSERKQKILCFAIEDYICNALPITSGDVQKKYISEISSATLRNELNALEAMGYLKQLHVSGGRVPTSQGYKFYVEQLLKNQSIQRNKLKGVKTAIKSRTSSISEIISQIAKVVSQQTNLPTVVFVSGYQKLIIQQITVVPLIENELLLLLKTKEGVVHCNIQSTASAKACEDAGYYLTKKFAGKSIGDLIFSMKGELALFDDELRGFASIVHSMIDVLENLLETGSMNIRRDGSAKLLCDAKVSPDETQNLFNLLEDEKRLKQSLVFEDGQREITCEIADCGDKKGCAIIKAPLVIGGQQVASVGVFGLQRMDYASIASVLRFVMNEMENINLNQLENNMEDKNGDG